MTVSEWFWAGVQIGAGLLGLALTLVFVCALLWVILLAVMWISEKVLGE